MRRNSRSISSIVPRVAAKKTEKRAGLTLNTSTQMSCMLAIVYRQFYLLRGSLTRFVPLFIWVAIDMILWGFITNYLTQITTAGIAFIPALLGAVLLWNFLVRVMHSVSMAFMEDIWSRNFLNLFASPMRVSDYLGGLIISSMFTAAVGLVVMILIAAAMFGLNIASYGIMVFPFLLILFLFGTALGVIGSALMLRLGPASEWFVWPIPALIVPFAGVYYPIETLPHWMQVIAHALPPMYVFEALRAIVAERVFDAHSLALGFGLAVLSVALACWVFIRVHKQAVRTGLLVRYTAESVA